jgi:pyridoxine kinase
VAILSIQSQVVRGAVGNSGATLILSRLGHEVWPLPTVLLSHHPGHGGARGGPLDPDRLASLLDGLEARGTFGDCAAVLSGYLGSAAAAGIVLRAVALARAANPGALFVLDPVMGDLGRTYVPETLVAAIRARLLPEADIVLPNPYELGLLAGAEPGDREEAFAALAALPTPIALLTGFAGADTPARTLDILLAAGETRLIATVPRIEGHFSGAGDAFAALFLGRYLHRRDAEAALRAAAAAMTRLLQATRAAGADELAIVAADAAWTAPSAADAIGVAQWQPGKAGCKSS